MTTTFKADWDGDTIAAVRVACLAAAEVLEAMGNSLPGLWNLGDAARLLAAAEDIRTYVESRKQVKQDSIAAELRRLLEGTQS